VHPAHARVQSGALYFGHVFRIPRSVAFVVSLQLFELDHSSLVQLAEPLIAVFLQITLEGWLPLEDVRTQ
jgi:hypothetical protein